MDSNQSDNARKDDINCHELDQPTAEERSLSEGLAPQAVGGEAAEPGCLSNTRALSSLPSIEGMPQYHISGGIDWFEWWGLVHWANAKRFSRIYSQLEDAKLRCQAEHKGHEEVFLRDFGPVLVKRTGFNRGGDRGHHLELSLRIPGGIVGISSRSFSLLSEDAKLKKSPPNFMMKQTGRDCLLFGAQEGFNSAEVLLSVLGGIALKKGISRGDLCLDVANLDVLDLLSLVKNHNFITRARSVRPQINHVTELETGFTAGKAPIYLNVYDKIQQLIGTTDALYARAMIDRRWGGVTPENATRIEYQLNRRWLVEHGIDTPEDFLTLRGKLCEMLTHDWFRMTERRIDPKNKHQSRATTHPLWCNIQQGFQAVFGPPEGILEPIQREKATPFALARQGRGCLANCLLQLGVKFETYQQFVDATAAFLLEMFSEQSDRANFMAEIARRRMEYIV